MARAKPASPAQLTADTRVAVFHGPDRFLQDLHTQKLREVLEEAHGGPGSVEIFRFDGATAALADILDECRSFGLMQQYKLVIVDAADQLLKAEEDGAPAKRSNRSILESYAAEPAGQATLLLRAERWYPGNLDKVIASVGGVSKLEPPSPGDAVIWAIGRCKKRHNATIAQDAAALLIDAIGVDLGRIDTELAKLALAQPGATITTDHVRDLVGVTREEELWSIQGLLLSGNAPAALGRLRDLIEVSRVDPVPLTWAYIDLARKIHGVARGLAQRENPGMLSKQYKLWGPSADAVFNVARKITPSQAAGLFQAAIDADHRQKTSAGDAVRTLETLTLRFTSVVQGRADL